MDSIKSVFYNFFEENPVIAVASPGRINLIGEHTDYNDGFVLPAAIDKRVEIAISHRNDKKISLFSNDFNEEFTIDISEIQPQKDFFWSNYILGVVQQLVEKNIDIPGFNIALQGNVPIGGGLSSSAALECVVVFALNEWLQLGLDKMEMIFIAQKAEHDFAGVQCGIMDQFASMFGKNNQVMMLDCRTMDFQYFPLDLQQYEIVLFDTQVKHSLATSEYNTRRAECEKAISLIQKKFPDILNLRDVSLNQIEECVKNLDEKAYKRAKFVVQENERVQLATQDLLNGNLIEFGKKMYETHVGLSELYEVSCMELDTLVDLVKNNQSVIGARLMGGGFGGCTINLIAHENTDDVIKVVSENYCKITGKTMKVYRVNIQNGTHLI
ncbi:MAG: galactokinase [Bacteroidetes bacterium]|nr:galactokinase [Bacteroidota bacterium]